MENMQKEIQGLKEQMKNLSKSIGNMEKNSEKDAKTIEEKIEKTIFKYIPKEKLQSIKEGISEKLSGENFEKVKKDSEEIIENAEEFTKKHPIATISLSLGIGYLLGRVFKK